MSRFTSKAIPVGKHQRGRNDLAPYARRTEVHTENVHEEPFEVVSIPMPLRQSELGRYFVGQTERLRFSQGTNAWATLYNPPDSGINLHVNVFTVTNVTETPFTTEIIFGGVPAAFPGNQATLISPTNLAIAPLPTPRVRALYNSSASGTISGGVNVFDREVPPLSTIVSEEDGKFIFPPGEAFVLLLMGMEQTEAIEAIAAFGWWEEPLT